MTIAQRLAEAFELAGSWAAVYGAPFAHLIEYVVEQGRPIFVSQPVLILLS